MRASPSFEMTIAHFGAWRAGVGALSSLGAVATLAWWFAIPSPVSAPQAAGVLVSVLCLAGTLGLAFGPPACRLRWDGQRWFCGPAANDAAELAPVDLSVAIDLGRWMLLCLRHEAAPRRRRPTWLPAQRLGHEAHWHALRRAVYSPRPAPGGPPAAAP